MHKVKNMTGILNQRAMRLNHLRQKNIDTDVVLECKGGTVNAHKIILISSSNYFDKMFSMDMIEKHTGHVNLKHVSREVMRVIVECLYTSQLEKLDQDLPFLQALIATCHLMEIQDLLHHAKDAFTQLLSMETFFDMWPFAVKFEFETNLKIRRFLDENMAEIAKSEKLISFTVFEMERFIDINPKMCHEKCIECVFQWKLGEGRNDDAIRMIETIGLNNLNSTSFLKLFKVVREFKTVKTVESVMVDELLKRFELKDFIPNGNSSMEECAKIAKMFMVNSLTNMTQADKEW